jgi:myo-inositol catabolism protein IolS
MKYRVLGDTDLNVSVVGLGTHQFSGEWAKEFSTEEVGAILKRAKEHGINFIDTAECYGDHLSEELIGKNIERDRDSWIIGSKFGHGFTEMGVKIDAWSPQEVLKQLEDSLKALRTDYIDVYQFHSGTNTSFDNQELWALLQRQVQLGKIRFLGLSIGHGLVIKNDLHQIEKAKEHGISTVQVVYNRLTTVAENAVFPLCKKEDLGVLARIPLARGFLSGRYKPGTQFSEKDIRSKDGDVFNNESLARAEEILKNEVPEGHNPSQWALAWCLKNPIISSAIVGCKTPEQVALNAVAADLIL